jgi:A/G-specific adenine glycosylase
MPRLSSEPADIPKLRRQLISWYDENQRDLPWRASKDPYAIWISEIMLQQTRVAVVVDRYQAFLERFPTLGDLARAQEQDVLALWSGLGYYRRARMLLKAAQFVVDNLSGKLPVTSIELRKLPGIGAYTAAAIASIAYDEPIAVVDGNVERVLCRLAGWGAGGRNSATALREKSEKRAAKFVHPDRPGEFNQAMMELGATVCLPRNPQCLVCPVSAHCKTRGEHKTTARPRMLSREVAHALSVRTSTKARKKGATTAREILLEQRPPSESVMPGMWELPKLRSAAVPEEDLRLTVRHAIMQVNYYVRIRTVFEDDIDALTIPGGERRWIPMNEAAWMALTGLTRKVLKRAHLLPATPLGTIADSIAPRAAREVL